MPTGAQGSKKGPPQLSGPDQLLDGAIQLWPKPLISVSTVRRHVFVGLPRLCLPYGVQWNVVLETESLSLLMT